MENIQEKERIKELEEEIESRKSKWDALCSTCDRLREENDNLQDKVLEGQRAIEKLEKLQELYANNASHYAGTNDIAYKTHKILAEDN